MKYGDTFLAYCIFSLYVRCYYYKSGEKIWLGLQKCVKSSDISPRTTFVFRFFSMQGFVKFLLWTKNSMKWWTCFSSKNLWWEHVSSIVSLIEYLKLSKTRYNLINLPNNYNFFLLLIYNFINESTYLIEQLLNCSINYKKFSKHFTLTVLYCIHYQILK